MSKKCYDSKMNLSDEQINFVEEAKIGKNILVDACIGSGKTTAIQYLCNVLPENLKILYLTYNRLLKIDAKEKIKNKNVTVTNYHGFAFMALKKNRINQVGVSDLIQTFNHRKPSINHYDVLIIDEYQDIEQELAEMLEYIKFNNPNIQIIAVGDMKQKIYDKTMLDVQEFINGFLDNYIRIEFTQCFRICKSLADVLARIWGKDIKGVNTNCLVEKMEIQDIVPFLAKQMPKDILCLGARRGDLSKTLNILEQQYPDKFNKKTVYASISDEDSGGNNNPKNSNAIFTTFDSSKGLERKICVVFDYTESYWSVRIKKPQQKYEILRNIFCVAASRGKEHIIFVDNKEAMISEETLSTSKEINHNFDNVGISTMFDFKYKEDVEMCYALLETKEILSSDYSEIQISNTDELIDLSPCIGIYQEACFFEKHNINKSIAHYIELNPKKNILYTDEIKHSDLDKKILFLSSLETNQVRYIRQVKSPFVPDDARIQIVKRLNTLFQEDEDVQVSCKIDFSDEDNGKCLFSAKGLADVVKDDVVYELKFVSELKHEHFLQCACYMVALGLKKGILWNTRNNTRYEIRIPDKTAFLNAVAITITKRYYHKYCKPYGSSDNSIEIKASEQKLQKNIQAKYEKNIIVIDTETNWNDEVMSIGIVIADGKNFNIKESKYYILIPESYRGGMYSDVLRLNEKDPFIECSRTEAIHDIKELSSTYHAQDIFAYNAHFDFNHLQELRHFIWHDILKIAAYRQYNHKITADMECCTTGRLKRNYSVQAIYKLLSNNESYNEKHNAIYDAIDELAIMRMLDQPVSLYEEKATIKIGEKDGKKKKNNNIYKTIVQQKGTHTNLKSSNEEKSYVDLSDKSITVKKNDANESSDNNNLLNNSGCLIALIIIAIIFCILMIM